MALLDYQAVLDVTFKEQSSGGAYMPLAAFPAHDQVLLVKCESRLEGARFEELMHTALRGTRQVADLMQARIRKHTKQLAGAKLALLR